MLFYTFDVCVCLSAGLFYQRCCLWMQTWCWWHFPSAFQHWPCTSVLRGLAAIWFWCNCLPILHGTASFSHTIRSDHWDVTDNSASCRRGVHVTGITIHVPTVAYGGVHCWWWNASRSCKRYIIALCHLQIHYIINTGTYIHMCIYIRSIDVCVFHVHALASMHACMQECTC